MVENENEPEWRYKIHVYFKDGSMICWDAENYTIYESSLRIYFNNKKGAYVEISSIKYFEVDKICDEEG